MSLMLEALRRGRSRPIPEPVHAARTDAVLKTLGQRRSGERTSLLHGFIVLAAVLLAAGGLAVFSFVPGSS